ncbi:MAG TPA: glycosyltransferase family 2 protein [Candidatus Polarisedimenticolia bacterium]|nr:glycosyltransferase family 2 protein [Candidatus Polarisedimenticolia bacterium]
MPVPDASNGRGVAVLIPCYNEEVTIRKVVDDFRRALPAATIYVFDNNSRDRTAAIAREAGALVVPSPRQGKGHVVRHMFASVEAEAYLMVDGDDTYPADQAERLLEAFRSGGVDMVVGARIERSEAGAFRRFHRFRNHLVARLIASLFRVPATDVMSGYRVFSRDFVKSIPLLSSGFEIETEMTLQAAAKGYVFREVPTDYGKRPEGSLSKLNTYSDGFLVLRTILLIFKDYKPLVFFTVLAVLFSLLSVAAGWGPVQDYVTTGFVPRFPRAILAAALGILAGISLGVGLILDTLAKFQREQFELWRRHFSRPPDA